MKTLVLQSHRLPLPAPWLQRCLDSAAGWARQSGFDYRFLDDELLSPLSGAVRARTRAQPVVATDLARLIWLERALSDGYEQAIWIDSDCLVFAPEGLILPPAEDRYALGREIWVQHQSPPDNRSRRHRATGKDPRAPRLRAHRQVHNAFLMFRQGNPFLDFYRHAAERMILAHDGPMVPQLVGPKLLTAIHNLLQCPVVESAGMLSPVVAEDVIAGGGPALDLFRKRSAVAPAALNLCASLLLKPPASALAVDALIDVLLAGGLARHD